MRIGICTSNIDEWPLAAALGYDFIEGSFGLLAGASEEEFARMLRVKEACSIPVEAYNCFFPSSFVLYNRAQGDAREAEQARIDEALCRHLQIGFSRAAALGGRVAVIGSSRVRTIPEGMDRAEGMRQFSRVLTVCADWGARYGIKVTVEPLSPIETDFINTLSDGLDLVEAVSHPNLAAMVDFFHSRSQKEPLSSLLRAGERLVHVHLCRADRDLPRLGDAETDLLPCLLALKQIGYGGRVSFEGNALPDFPTAARAALDEWKRLLNHPALK